MAIRDLGYRTYDGVLSPTSASTWVMLRHGLRRAWSRGVVKLGVFLSLLPFLIAAVLHALITLMFQQPQDTSRTVLRLLLGEMWTAGLIISTAAGSSAIADDLAHRAHVFYFSKPILPWQYALGRTLAVTLLLLAVLLIPGVLLCAVASAIGPSDKLLQNAGAVFPTIAFATLSALVLGVLSVSISAWSKSRAITTTSWITLFLVPHVLATVVDAVASFPYVKLLSVTALLSTVGEGLFQVAPSDVGRMRLYWHEALPVLLIVVAASGWFAYRRLLRVEVL